MLYYFLITFLHSNYCTVIKVVKPLVKLLSSRTISKVATLLMVLLFYYCADRSVGESQINNTN